MPPISEAIRGSGRIEHSYVSTKAKKASTLRGPAQLADLQGAICVLTNNLTNGVVLSLTCYCSRVPPNVSDIYFLVAILLLLSIEPTTHVPSGVASQWRERPLSYNGDHNSSDMTGAPPVGRRARTTRTTPSNYYVRTTMLFGAHSSSRFWSL